MPDELDSNQQPNTNPQSPTVGEPPAPPAPPVQTQQAPQNGKVVSMPSSAIAKMRREEREKGKKAMQAELDAHAKKLGFESHAALVAAAEVAKKTAGKGASPAQPQPAVKPAQRVVPVTRVEKDKAAREAELIKARRAAAMADKKLRRERRANAKLTAEYALREAAVRSGITDPDYALHLLRKQLAGKSAADLESFDETKFFSGLRDTHAYLFGVTVAPASTSPGAKPGEGAPTGGAPKAPAPAEGAPTDARKMSREEYNAHLEKLGVRNPALGYSH